MKNRNITPVAYCAVHGKFLFSDRKRARAHARQHRSERKSVYPCDARQDVELWHVGGLADEVRRGHVSRDEYYHRSAS